jgi:hypothetical protein
VADGAGLASRQTQEPRPSCRCGGPAAVRAYARRGDRSRGHGALATTLRSSDTATAIVVASAGVLPETQYRCGLSARGPGACGAFFWAQAHIRPKSGRRFLARLHPPENEKSRNHAGFRDGETRTRTGDTTILSRYLQAARRREIPGNDAVSAKMVQRSDVWNLRSFPGGSGVDGPLRPKAAARPDWVRRVTRDALRPRT